MHSQRPRLSIASALALCANLTACYTIVPIAGDAGADDASAPRDSATSDTSTPTDAGPTTPDVTFPVDASSPPDGASADASAPTDAPSVDGGPVSPGGSVDLLVVVDDSNSMERSIGMLRSYLGATVVTLLDRHRVGDVRIGVVTTNLGTPGAAVPGCMPSDTGDDAVLNPRARGAAARMREQIELGSAFCTGAVLTGPFVTLRSSDDAMSVVNTPACQVALSVGGCGIEQPLEAAYRALVTQAAPGRPNAGFLREGATLAILVLTDEEDGSVRDCRYHDGVGACSDATDVFQAASARWASPDLNLRFYLGAPGSAQDPTWPIERYVDPQRLTRGLLGLKPGHPERIVFGAITGVPLTVPTTATGTDWDALLGPAPAGRAEDFTARNGALAYDNPTDPSGPTSMRQANRDPSCAARVVPACRAPGTLHTNACTPSEQPFAWPSRRVAEVARRFDRSPLCAGAACGNGMVASICATGDSTPFVTFANLIARRVAR